MAFRALLLLVLSLPAPACRTSFDVERRETRVNVWLTVPDLAANGGRIDALIYVGPYKVVEGPVTFPKGSPTVNLPPLFIRAGPRDVSAVLAGGRYSIRETVEIEKESWIQVVLVDNAIGIEFDDEQPNPWGR